MIVLLIRSTLTVWRTRTMNVPPMSYKLVFDDLVFLKKILNGCLPIYASDFWDNEIGVPRTRLSDKVPERHAKSNEFSKQLVQSCC